MIFKACAVGTIKYDKKSIQQMSLSKESMSSSEENKESQNSAMHKSDLGDYENSYEVLPYMKRIIAMRIDEKEAYNEYKFGNIIISKQIDFLHYFWMALSLCHEVISISKNKQKLKKMHDDDMFIFHDNNQQKQVNLIKKMTYDNRLLKKITITKEEIKDDFKIGNADKLLDNGEISEHEMNEREDEELDKESSIDSISEMEIEEDDELVYHGMSPDEITLVNAAKDVGFEFRYRSNKEIEIRIGGVKHQYYLLKLFPFTSERKRMTIVVQDPNDPEYAIAFTKGADNVMKALSLEQFSSHFEFKYITQFAKKGYRTLIVGMKVIRYDEFKEWEEAYDELNKEIENVNQEEMNQLVYLIEKDLFLLGTTALEDRLQDNVHECIEEFRRADIKVWMITGDKLETAENVGIESRLLHDDGERMYFTETDAEEASKSVRNAYKLMKLKIRQHGNIKTKYNDSDDSDLEREDSKGIEKEESKQEQNTSTNNIDMPRINQIMDSRTTKSQPKRSDQNLVDDLFNPNKKLKITEKKLFIKQIVLNSSINTSFNPNKVKAAGIAEINFEVVVEGDCLSHLLKPENRKIFGKIIRSSHVVLVCRASPKQKAEVIAFAKSLNPKMVSLAIGDGGNDVSMIKEADVGIGIFGKEGYQAVAASDYAIGEFQFLKRLIFLHGRYCTRRMTIFITQFLLKNLIFSLSQLFFAFYSGYSGQTFFEPGYVTVFNTFAAQLFICYLAVYDQDINIRLDRMKDKLLLPYLYAETRDKTSFNLKEFIIWYAYGI